MKSVRFYFHIILRVLLITLNCFGIVFFISYPNRPITIAFLIITLVIQVVWLIRFLSKIHQYLANFLISLQEDDTTQGFSTKNLERYFRDVIINLDTINERIQTARISKEQQEHYTREVIDHAAVGLLSFTENGKIELANKAAIHLFGLSNLENTRRLVSSFPELRMLLSGDNSVGRQLIKLQIEGTAVQMAVKRSQLKINDSLVTILSFQDIRHELTIQELDAWKKLIRVMRHEILNSITPIVTLTGAIRRNFIKDNKPVSTSELSESQFTDIVKSASLIEDRSKGLITFVEQFRSITNLPEPKLSVFSVSAFFEKIIFLFREEAEKSGIEIALQVIPQELDIMADADLLQQVIINLVKNALESIGNRGGTVRLEGKKLYPEEICLSVTDNGPGVPEEYLDSIFTPSFTTKKNGSGIGLSLSREIIQQHKGLLELEQSENSTCLIIRLPAHPLAL